MMNQSTIKNPPPPLNLFKYYPYSRTSKKYSDLISNHFLKDIVNQEFLIRENIKVG